MLVSAKQTLMTPLLKRPGEDPNAEAAAGLQSGLQGAMLQALQNNVQAQTAQAGAQVQESASQLATQQVSEATKISDNVDEAFAKTRVSLQTFDPSKLPDELKTTSTPAMNEFKEYMSKTPEQRMRDSILQEMGLTEEEVKAMPPEKQQAIGEEIAQRMQDKSQIAKVEKEERNDNQDNGQVADKFLASL